MKLSPGDWRYIGEERTELLDFEPGKFVKLHIIRENA